MFKSLPEIGMPASQKTVRRKVRCPAEFDRLGKACLNVVPLRVGGDRPKAAAVRWSADIARLAGGKVTNK